MVFPRAEGHCVADGDDGEGGDQEGCEGDFEAWVAAGVVVLEGEEGFGDDLLFGDVEALAGGDFAFGRRLALGDFAESRVDGAWAEGEDVDVVREEFDAEGFGEAGHVGFAGGIDGKVRDWEGGREGAHVEDVAAAVGDHRRENRVGQFGEGFDI